MAKLFYVQTMLLILFHSILISFDLNIPALILCNIIQNHIAPDVTKLTKFCLLSTELVSTSPDYRHDWIKINKEDVTEATVNSLTSKCYWYSFMTCI